jgi:hypothetical protein
MPDDGLSVREAMDRLMCSESTLRRRLKPEGDLETVPDSSPVRVTRASVDAAQAVMTRRMGLSPATPQDPCTNTQPTDGRIADLQREVERLTAELTLTKGVLADLTTAHSALLDTFRRLSAGAVPNN